MLIGLSAKNAILIVEFAKADYESGQSIVDAALAAVRLRLRPILMTAFAFILGCVPLWIINQVMIMRHQQHRSLVALQMGCNNL